MNAITAENLSLTYPGGKEAVRALSFALPPGEIFGFLGPNGAGKTTTVKVLTGMLKPTGGTGRVFDFDPASDPVSVHALAGVITEHAQMYDNLTGYKNLLFYATLFGLDAAAGQHQARELLERLGLTSAAEQRLATYSTGMRQRLSLARALLHEPKVLFLDEPTSGLDPESVKEVNDLIVRLAHDRGTTVFLCTHQLRYAEEICSCYGLMDEGHLLATGTLAALRSRLNVKLTVSIKAAEMPPQLNARPGANGFYTFPIASEAEIPALVQTISAGGGKIYHVSAEQPSLEQIYFHLLEQRKGEFPHE